MTAIKAFDQGGPVRRGNGGVKEAKPLKGNHMKLLEAARQKSRERFSPAYRELVHR